MEQVIKADDIGLESDLWKLYGEYKKLLLMDQAFVPEAQLILNDAESEDYNNLGVALVESVKRLDVHRQDIRVYRRRAIPPTVNLKLQNVNLPGVNIGNLPAGLSQAQIKQLVEQVVSAALQQALQQASAIAAGELVKALPGAGFERITLKDGWVKEG